MMDNMRLHRRPDGSAVIGVWQRILFQEIPGGMLINGSVWELELRRWGWLGSIGIGLQALGLRGNERWLGARRELEGAMQGQGREDFIDGPLWVGRQCG